MQPKNDLSIFSSFSFSSSSSFSTPSFSPLPPPPPAYPPAPPPPPASFFCFSYSSVFKECLHKKSSSVNVCCCVRLNKMAPKQLRKGLRLCGPMLVPHPRKPGVVNLLVLEGSIYEPHHDCSLQ